MAQPRWLPTGDWTLAETGTDLLTVLTGMFGAADAAAILGIAYIYDFPYQGELRNVATQHVVDGYVLPRDVSFGYAVQYDGNTQRVGDTDYIHIYSATAPTATHVRIGLVFRVFASATPPATPTAAQIGPGVFPPGGGSLWISIPAGPQDIPALIPGAVVALPVWDFVGAVGPGVSLSLPRGSWWARLARWWRLRQRRIQAQGWPVVV